MPQNAIVCSNSIICIFGLKFYIFASYCFWEWEMTLSKYLRFILLSMRTLFKMLRLFIKFSVNYLFWKDKKQLIIICNKNWFTNYHLPTIKVSWILSFSPSSLHAISIIAINLIWVWFIVGKRFSVDEKIEISEIKNILII